MLFKHPEILYFLALLIIPILVHLFQLQKFVKTPFTNVAFLQKLTAQTRKSSQLKKWLILITRMLIFIAIIFAFSQPYFSKNTIDKKQHIFLYLDNSLSTNTKGEKGNLLQNSIQEIKENISDNNTFSLLTNSHFYKNKTAIELKKIILKTKHTAKNLKLFDILLKIENQKSNKTNTSYKNILISDFQNINKYKKQEFTNVKQPVSFIKLKATQKNNLSIDSVFVNDFDSSNFTLNISIKNQGEAKSNIPVALFNQKKLVSKQSFSIEKNTEKTIQFTTQNKGDFSGKILLDFNDTFRFDNSFYFTLNRNQKINTLSIGKSSKFLSKIYTKKEFNFSNFSTQNINYNTISKQQLIILNEIEKIPTTLQKSLLSFSENGGHLVIIPNSNSQIKSYNTLFRNLNIGKINSKKKDSLKITKIHYKHPFFKDVFSKNSTNFQSPFVTSYFSTTFKNNTTILSFQNNKAFIKQINNKYGKTYWFSSPISLKTSNFSNSPLIVPIFYNFGKYSLQHSKLFFTIGQENQIDIVTSLKKNIVLSIKNSKNSFIPMQKTHQTKVSLFTKTNPLVADFYYVTNNTDTLKTIAFNYSKNESLLQFLDLKEIVKTNKNIRISSSIQEVLKDFEKKNKVQWLWKWFLALAIVSLLVEILILKFFKP